MLQAAVQGVQGGGCQGRALWVQVSRVIGTKSAGGRACGASEAQWRVPERSAQPTPPPAQSARSSEALGHGGEQCRNTRRQFYEKMQIKSRALRPDVPRNLQSRPFN